MSRITALIAELRGQLNSIGKGRNTEPGQGKAALSGLRTKLNLSRPSRGEAVAQVTTLVSDLRERPLWLVAIALVLAIVTVPVVLSSDTKGAQGLQSAPLAVPATQLAAYPAVTIQAAPTVSELSGKGRDPFSPQKASAASAGTSSTSGGTASGSSPTSLLTATPPASATGLKGAASGNSSGGSGGIPAGSGSTPSTPSTTPPAPSTSTPSTPAPAGLAANEAYHVTMAITNSGGGLDSIDPLERLSLVPSTQRPLLIELGVLKGGSRVLFAVQPGTVLSGPGSCTPGPIDCEILALGQDQVEQLSTQSPSGVLPVAEFAVTAIKADQYSSAAAADQARNLASAAGRNLLSKSALTALALFQYEPSIGAVVDLRDLTVGGN